MEITKVSHSPTMLRSALQFYEGRPDGQYDDVAVECIRSALEKTVPEALRNIGCEAHTDVRAPHCPICLDIELSELRAFYEGVRDCMADTWECHGCGISHPWWKDSNADYATREATAKISARSPPRQIQEVDLTMASGPKSCARCGFTRAQYQWTGCCQVMCPFAMLDTSK